MSKKFGAVVLLDPTWDIRCLTKLTPTFHKLFKGVRTFSAVSPEIQGSNLLAVKMAIHAIGQGILDNYVSKFLQSNAFALGQITQQIGSVASGVQMLSIS